MKRILLVMVVLITFTAAGLFAQVTGLESVQSYSTFGVFGNELDDALNVSGISDLEQKMVFGGLSNLNFLDSTVEADDTFNADLNDPLWLGYYSPDALAHSLFAGFYGGVDSTNLNEANTVAITTTNKTVTDTTYTWNDQVTETQYTANVVLDEIDFSAQFLTSLSGMNVGLALSYYVNNQTDKNVNNYTTTETNYYDTAAAGEAPSTAVDYVFTETYSAMDINSIIGLKVPVFLTTGALKHTIVLGADFDMQNYNAVSGEQTYTNPADTILGVQTVQEDADKTANSLDILIDAHYDLAIPGLFNKNDANELTVRTGIDAAINTATYATSNITQNYNWTAVNTAPDVNARAENTTDDTVAGGIDFFIDAGLKHSFYYDLGETLRFGLIPGLGVNVNIDNPDYAVTERVSVGKADGDADGAFTSAADTITTTTTEYTNSAYTSLEFGTIGASSSVFEIGTTFSLSGAVEFTPADWPISVMLGSQPTLSLTNTSTTNNTSTAKATTVVADGTGATTSTTITEEADVPSVSTWTHDVTVSAAHRIGLSMQPADPVRIDVALNLSTANNILDFKDLVVQALIKLP